MSPERMRYRLTVTHFFIFLFIFICGVKGQTYDGYTLYSKMGATNAYLIDMSGANYHTWSMSGQTGYSCYLLPNQTLLRSVQYSGNQLNGAAMCGMVQKYDWNGTLTWQFIYSTANYCSHHDIHPMPNGNVLLIVYEVKTPTQVTAAGCSQNITMWPDEIVEIQPSGTTGGTVVWEWHAWDHLVQDHDATKSNYGVVANHPELININYNTQKEWMHANGIDYNPQLDQIVFSSHNLNEFYVIDHSTTTAQAASHTGGNSGKGGDILYRWGNPAAYNQGTTSNRVFNVVHDAHWIAQGLPWAGRLVGFNNKGATGNHSCIDMVNPPYNGYTYSYTSGAYTPSTYNWRHVCLGDAQDQSSSQKLPNGNLLICISSTGYLYEIDSNQVLKWSKTLGGTIAKAYRYSPCYVNGALSVTSSASPTTLCSGGSSQLTTTVTGGSGSPTYSWISVPPGFTSTLQNPVVSPTVTTNYIVTVTNVGCTGSDTVPVTVQAQPTVNATAAPTAVCLGQSSQLNATVNGSGTFSYSWSSVPAGFTSTLQNPIVNPGGTTKYIVTISGNGCSATDSVTVELASAPIVTATAIPSTVCAGSTTQLNVSASGTLQYSYSWVSDPPGFTSNLQNPLATPLVTTVYTSTAGSGGCEGSGSVTVYVNSLPETPTITTEGDSLVSSSGTGNQWFIDGTLVPGSTGRSIALLQPGSYQVQVTDANSCTSALSAPFIFVGTNDITNAGLQTLIVYPVPSTGTITLAGSAVREGGFTASIHSTYGTLLLQTTQQIIDLSSLSNGTYILAVETSKGNLLIRKIVLIR
jgi:hypothetical protein